MSIFDEVNNKLDQKKMKDKFTTFDRDRTTLLKALSNDFSRFIKPLAEAISDKVVKSMSFKIAAPVVNVPPANITVKASEVNVPKPEVTVNMPPVKIPEIRMPDMNWPDGEMPIKGFVQLMGVDTKNPLPVELRTADGKPLDISGGGNTVIGGGGGIAKQVKINNTSSNPVPVTMAASTSSSASAIIDSSGVQYSGDNPVPVVFGAGATTAVNIVDSTGEAYSGSNPVPIAGAVTGTFYQVTQPISGTVDTELPAAAALADNMANPTTPLIGACQMVWDGSNWDRIGGSGATGIHVDIAGNTIGIATSAKQLADNHGVISTPISVRGSRLTAYVSLANGTEATLLAAQVGYFTDLIQVMGANQSDVAITLDIRDMTAGSVIATLEIPANGTAGISGASPIPQANQGNAWTVDMPDDSGAVVDITALFQKVTP